MSERESEAISRISESITKLNEALRDAQDCYFEYSLGSNCSSRLKGNILVVDLKISKLLKETGCNQGETRYTLRQSELVG